MSRSIFTVSLFLSFVLMLPGVASEAFAGRSTALAAGTEAPDFSLKNLDGDAVSLHELLEDGPVLLDFWALWCKPCKKGLPGTNDLYKEFEEKGLSVVAVNVDSPRSTSKVRSYVKSQRYEFEVLLDPNSATMRLYQFRSIPQLFLVSRDGTIAYSKMGWAPGQEIFISREIEKLLAEDGIEASTDEEG